MIKYKLINKAAYFPKEKILVLGDLHLGYEDYLREQGIMIPKNQFKETLDDLDRIFDYLLENKFKVKEIVILGDLKHEFSGNLRQEWSEVHKLLDYLHERVNKIVIVKGNHDNYLMNVIKEKARIVDFYVVDDIGFIHGNKIFPEVLDKKIKLLVLGHKHPAVTLTRGSKKERYKCFLVGKSRGKEILILPSFFPLVEGSDVFIDDTNLAIKLNLKKFRIWIPVPNEVRVLEFGEI